MKLDFKEAWTLVRKTFTAWSDDFAPSMGAALSYYTLFSIAPLLVIVIAIVGLVFGHDVAQEQILAQLRGLMGDEGANAIQTLLKGASDPQKSGFAAIVGAVGLLIGATTVFGELKTDLDRVWEVPAAIKQEGLWGMLRSRLLSFGMILVVGFLLLVSLVLSAALAALGSSMGSLFDGIEWLLQGINFLISFGVITLLFAMLYKMLPSASIDWRDVWIGAAVTSLLFTIGKTLIGLYIGKSSIASAFGAFGSIAVLLIWVYYSAQIFLLGAEFTWVYAHDVGSMKKDRGADASAPGKLPVAEAVTEGRKFDSLHVGGRHAATPPASAIPHFVIEKPLATLGILGAAFVLGGALDRAAEILGEKWRAR